MAAFNDGDVDGYLGHFDPSSLRWVAGLTQPLTLTEIRANLWQFHAAFEGLHLHEILLFGQERFVCARWRMRGVHVNDYLGIAPTRRSIDVETCEIYELGDDLVVTTWTYGDVGHLFRQITLETDRA
ncbi:MAG TPA: ester cyclase [Acidimicrobiales bacterium]